MKYLNEILNQPYNFKDEGMIHDPPNNYQQHLYSFHSDSENHYNVGFGNPINKSDGPKELTLLQKKEVPSKTVKGVNIIKSVYNNKEALKEKNPFKVYSTVAAITKHHMQNYPDHVKNGIEFSGFNNKQHKLYSNILKHHGIDHEYNDDYEYFSIKNKQNKNIE